ncbi:polysaccharide biosynthesis protein [Actinoplanes sp. KI2]|uniref:NAD-dependent epimerase/dehydratase family protein n=1 Tax=Actinoplanes sp. KI2 TaxID=2983315 RepID=UPI0021D5CF7E|nr:polysaccharide biosynthesis protein [Actinoplanes sp. KI2]MCU7731162.1 polysaccharide biosynthesis protein [Actinoplanes sp. KI2]
MNNIDALIERMAAEVPPGHRELPGSMLDRLAELTAELLDARPDCTAELDRYLSVQHRSIPVPPQRVAELIGGQRIVVTGGSGCLGTVLLDQLTRLGPRELVSVSLSEPDRPVPGVRYETVDIRDRGAVDRLLHTLRPSVVFHLAAERDPGLAEREAARTLHTNAIGTRNVAESAEDAGVAHFGYASTGKALRPYSSDVYAESKRMGEWVMGQVASRGTMNCAGTRFTHVVDNSIVLRRFRQACRLGRPVRLHSPHTLFYAQSAIESAQLMLVALAEPNEPVFRLCMIRDLDWPIRLLDVALGIVRESGRAAPLYIAGFEPGYEPAPYPGLYDPQFAGDLSPLINALEAPLARPSASPAVDVVPMPALPSGDLLRRMTALEQHCLHGDDARVRATADELAWAMLDETLRLAAPGTLRRIVRLTTPYRAEMTAEHLRMDDMFRRHAGGAPEHTPEQQRAAIAAR